MCVAAVAWRAHPRWPLVMIGNRDEFHDRPAAPLAAWADGSGVIAGRDLRSGGTWLGIAPGRERFALVTNVRNPAGADPVKASRGALVTDALTGADDDLATIDGAAFNPFNLVVASPAGLRFVTNRPRPHDGMLPPGIYGLSNGALDEPWPKTLALKAALAGWLTAAADTDRMADTAPLFAALLSERLPHGADAPRPDARDPATTPPFIRDPDYGTRCATVLVVGAGAAGSIEERRFAASGAAAGGTVLGFAWGSPVV